MLSFYIHHDHGYAFRNIPEGNSYAWPTELNKTKECEERYLKPHDLKDADYCYETQPTTQKDKASIVLLGDSHANQFLPAFLDSDAATQGIRYISAGACSILKGFSRFEISGPSRGEFFCPRVMDLNYSLIEKYPPSTIMISSRYTLDFELNDYQEYKAQWKSFAFKNLDHLETLKKHYKESFNFFLTHSQKVIFIHQIPELTFDPLKCGSVKPPFTFQAGSTFGENIDSQNHLNPQCKMLRSDVERRQNSYREILKTTLEELKLENPDLSYDKIRFIDPLKFLCDEKFCYVKLHNQLLYRDNNHLSLQGSRYIWKEVEKFL